MINSINAYIKNQPRNVEIGFHIKRDGTFSPIRVGSTFSVELGKPRHDSIACFHTHTYLGMPEFSTPDILFGLREHHKFMIMKYGFRYYLVELMGNPVLKALYRNYCTEKHMKRKGALGRTIVEIAHETTIRCR